METTQTKSTNKDTTNRGSVIVRCDLEPDLHRRLKVAAIQQGVTISALMADAVSQMLLERPEGAAR